MESFDQREVLAGSRIQCEMCIRTWLPMLESMGVDIPTSIKDAFDELDIDAISSDVSEDDILDHVIEYMLGDTNGSD